LTLKLSAFSFFSTFFEKLAENDTVVAPTATPTTQTFTLFNSDPKYGLNSLFSSAAIDFQTLSSVEDGFNYAGEKSQQYNSITEICKTTLLKYLLTFCCAVFFLSCVLL